MANESSAHIAAKWWTSILANPTPNNFYDGDKTNDASLMYMEIGHMKALLYMASDEQLDDFCTLLTKRIETELSKRSSITLYCDYDPCTILSECAEKAGINLCLFPIERMMRISKRTVEVKEGHGANWKSLFSKD